MQCLFVNAENKNSLSEFAKDDAAIQEMAKLSRQASKLRQELSISKAQIKELEADLEESERRSDLISKLDKRRYKPPKWLVKTGKQGTGVVCTILSDTHFDEVVKPEEIQYRNEYNRKIAVQRLKTYFQKIILLWLEP